MLSIFLAAGRYLSNLKIRNTPIVSLRRNKRTQSPQNVETVVLLIREGQGDDNVNPGNSHNEAIEQIPRVVQIEPPAITHDSNKHFQREGGSQGNVDPILNIKPGRWLSKVNAGQDCGVYENGQNHGCGEDHMPRNLSLHLWRESNAPSNTTCPSARRKDALHEATPPRVRRQRRGSPSLSCELEHTSGHTP
jgi:hypothetical protein